MYINRILESFGWGSVRIRSSCLKSEHTTRRIITIISNSICSITSLTLFLLILPRCVFLWSLQKDKIITEKTYSPLYYCISRKFWRDMPHSSWAHGDIFMPFATKENIPALGKSIFSLSAGLPLGPIKFSGHTSFQDLVWFKLTLQGTRL